MRFSPTELPGVVVVDVEPRGDERGLFARTFCAEEFAAHGLVPAFTQCNLSFNRARGTVRGLHLQVAPAADAKLVRCAAGAVLDVAVDLRPGSPTHRRHVAVELTAANRRALFVPVGCAHGFQTLADDTEVVYQHSAPYDPEHERGARHDDPELGIAWPLPVKGLSPKDASWPLLDPPRHHR